MTSNPRPIHQPHREIRSTPDETEPSFSYEETSFLPKSEDEIEDAFHNRLNQRSSFWRSSNNSEPTFSSMNMRQQQQQREAVTESRNSSGSSSQPETTATATTTTTPLPNSVRGSSWGVVDGMHGIPVSCCLAYLRHYIFLTSPSPHYFITVAQ